MAKRRADVISVNDLSRSVDKAVALAAKRLKVKPERANLVIDWEIIGRILRDVRDVDAAFGFANEVTRGVKLRGIKADPAFARIGRDILVGFIERGQLPRQIGR